MTRLVSTAVRQVTLLEIVPSQRRATVVDTEPTNINKDVLQEDLKADTEPEEVTKVDPTVEDLDRIALRQRRAKVRSRQLTESQSAGVRSANDGLHLTIPKVIGVKNLLHKPIQPFIE